MFEQKCQGAVDVISGGDRISGEHVAELASVLEARLERGQPQIVLDLQGVALIDSAGLELLFDCQEKCQRMGGALKLANAGRAVSRGAEGDGRGCAVRNLSRLGRRRAELCAMNASAIHDEQVQRAGACLARRSARATAGSRPTAARRAGRRSASSSSAPTSSRREQLDHGAGRRLAEGLAAGRSARRDGHGAGGRDPAVHRRATWACRPCGCATA